MEWTTWHFTFSHLFSPLPLSNPHPTLPLKTHTYSPTHPQSGSTDSSWPQCFSVASQSRTWVPCLWWGALRSSLSTLILAHWMKMCHRTFNQQTLTRTLHTHALDTLSHTLTHTYSFIMLAVLYFVHPFSEYSWFSQALISSSDSVTWLKAVAYHRRYCCIMKYPFWLLFWLEKTKNVSLFHT